MAVTMDDVMTCRELVDFLGECVAGTLDAGTRVRFDAHLAKCAACVEYLRGYRDTIRLAKDAGRDDEATAAAMPAELVDAIVAAGSDRRR
jgi:anti-sigma factor RsiW